LINAATMRVTSYGASGESSSPSATSPWGDMKPHPRMRAEENSESFVSAQGGVPSLRATPGHGGQGAYGGGPGKLQVMG